jgi:nicotinate-nucleotide pyrophosphorylase (carboxylating)
MNNKDLVKLALEEDLGLGDITTEAIFSAEKSVAYVYAKQDGIICGIDFFIDVFDLIDPELDIEIIATNGSSVKNGDTILKMKGNTASILKGERTALNFLGKLSGISTITDQFQQKISHTKAMILDTRKTTPLYRFLEKFAVRIGGGKNHRMGLYDMVMIKDNHIYAAGSITSAVNKVRKHLTQINREDLKIEVEVKNIVEFKEAHSLNIDRIMLDNMSINDMRDCVGLNEKSIEIEASGNVNLAHVVEVAETGVDFISIGKITHSAPCFDFSLRIENN